MALETATAEACNVPCLPRGDAGKKPVSIYRYMSYDRYVMISRKRFYHSLVVPLLALAMLVAGLPPLATAADGVNQPAKCCCGDHDSRCSGMSCCVSDTPQQDAPTSLPGRKFDDSRPVLILCKTKPWIISGVSSEHRTWALPPAPFPPPTSLFSLDILLLV